jgi:hypothetical protein
MKGIKDRISHLRDAADELISGVRTLDKDRASRFVRELCEVGRIDRQLIGIAADVVEKAPEETTTTYGRLLVDTYVMLARKPLDAAMRPDPVVGEAVRFGRLPERPSCGDYAVALKTYACDLKKEIEELALKRYLGSERNLDALALAYNAAQSDYRGSVDVDSRFSSAYYALVVAAERGDIQHDNPWAEFYQWVSAHYDLAPEASKQTKHSPKRRSWRFGPSAPEPESAPISRPDPWAGFKPDRTIA